MAKLVLHGSVAGSILVSLALVAVSACSSSSDDGTSSDGSQAGTSQVGTGDDDSTSTTSGGGGSLAPTGGSGTHVGYASSGADSSGSTSPTGGTSSNTTGSGGTETDPGLGWAGGDQIPITTTKALDCGGSGCQCNNGIDDDGDGLIDGFDTECVSPYDNDEGTFATGIPGDNSDPKWQDCFFDGNSGAGDDGCRYSTKCLTGELPMTDPDCTVTQDCIDFCAPMTPNGCDCFGCCEVTDHEGVEHFVFVTGACSTDKLDDPKTCIPCTQSDQCGNECGECELCPGMTPQDLPASCTPPPQDDGAAGAGGTDGAGGAAGAPPDVPNYTCDNGMPVCALDIPCQDGQFCMNGCCMWMGL
jgi:hypothetical protein